MPLVGFLLFGAANVAAQTEQPNQTITAGQFLGVFGRHVQDKDGSDAGRLWDVLVDDNGQPLAAVLDYGGILGVGRRKVAVAWQALHFTPADAAYPIHVTLTRQQLGAIPEFKYGPGSTIVGDGR